MLKMTSVHKLEQFRFSLQTTVYCHCINPPKCHLFHLYCKINFANVDCRLEKNEVITITQPFKSDADAESISIPLKESITINQSIKSTPSSANPLNKLIGEWQCKFINPGIKTCSLLKRCSFFATYLSEQRAEGNKSTIFVPLETIA